MISSRFSLIKDTVFSKNSTNALKGVSMRKSKMNKKILILAKLVEKNRPTRIMGKEMKSIRKLKRLSLRGITESCLARFLKRKPKKLTIVKKKTNKTPLGTLKLKYLKILMIKPKEIENMIR